MRWRRWTVILMPAALAWLALADVVAFWARAVAVGDELAAERSAGVPAVSLLPVERQLRDQTSGWTGLRGAIWSGAVVRDPFLPIRRQAEDAEHAALTAARRRAAAALARRRMAGGPGDPLEGDASLAGVRTPARADRLARRWDREAAELFADRQRLAAASGGLIDGEPADVVTASRQLAALIVTGDTEGVPTATETGTLLEARRYLAAGYPQQLTDHSGVLATLDQATSELQQDIQERIHADRLLAALPALLARARAYGAGTDFDARAARVEAQVQASRSDPPAFPAAMSALDQLVTDLQAADRGFLPTAGIPCLAGAPSHLIVIHLATQQLVAYQDGCPILRTPVTTGMPALPTGQGTFHIFSKSPWYHMISPWPPGNPFYYPPTWVSDAMEFIGNGTFIHGASWEPDSAFGPGSNLGPFGSHGCVHVMDGPLQQLYDWAPIGTTVVVET